MSAGTPSGDDGSTSWDEARVYWDTTRPTLEPLPANPNTVYVPFLPSTTSNFTFQATLDGTNYIVIVGWNWFGERYYVNIYDTSQTLILSTGLVGSPDFYNINLTGPLFTTLLVYRAASGNFEIIG